MKKLIRTGITALALVGSIAPTAVNLIAPTALAQSAETVLGKGSFAPINATGTGNASLVKKADGSLVLRFDAVKISDGPGLRVWLAAGGKIAKDDKSAAQSAYVDLGEYKPGQLEYAVPKGVDPSVFKNIFVWCSTVNLGFAGASLNAAGASSVSVVKSGRFYDLEAPTTGNALVVKKADGKTVLELQGFKTEVGPDLEVWLSAAEKPVKGAKGLETAKYVKIAVLKDRFTGDFEFEIPAGTDLSQFKSIVLWCAAVATPFGAAALQ